jgi:hypothetical protein
LFYDIEGLIEHALVLQPKEGYKRRVTATVVDFPEKIYQGHPVKVGLDFWVSTLLLPRLGRYSVTKRFIGPDYVTAANGGHGPPFWKGVASSPRSRSVSKSNERFCD